ncbi:MAG: fibronectin type III domain-containing protein [Paludibacteraceae bacterium]|nr:fibronectin type III domain-containing protein [Paludibacteraceae bacterium]
MNRRILSFCCALIGAMTLNAATINVTPGSGTIAAAVKNASAGDVFVLTNGTYAESSVKPTVAITIKAADNTQPVITLTSRMEIKADFTLQGVTIQSTTDVLRALTGDALYDLTIDNCIFRTGGSSANSARAIYAGEAPNQLRNVSITNCTFDGGKSTGRFIYLNGGSDLTAITGTALIDHCTFYNTTDTRGVYPANLDKTHITNCIFMNAEEKSGAVSFAVYGSNSYVHNCLTFNAPVKVSTGGTQAGCVVRNPYFIDPANGNFQLYANSSAINMGTDGSTIGDPRWGVSTDSYNTDNDPYVPYKMPYSMAPTTNSVKVLWQMSEETEPTQAVVYYGTDSTNLDMQITTDAGWVVSDEGYVHVVTLPNLQPNTRYYFTVGASATRRCPKISWTKTAPEAGTAYRIFTISDIHGNSCNNWSNMQDFICNLNCDVAQSRISTPCPTG